MPTTPIFSYNRGFPRLIAFRYKDYRRNGQARYRAMTLTADEFIRRFLLHVLPTGFHRIRQKSAFISLYQQDME